jgi:predicted DNA binding CopG/RHH family protein
MPEKVMEQGMGYKTYFNEMVHYTVEMDYPNNYTRNF